MKIQIDIPDEVKPDYGRIHNKIAQQLGIGSPGFNHPLTIEQSDCTTHPDNYTLVAADHLDDPEGWRFMAVLKFKHPPFVKPPRPADVYDDETRLQVMDDYQERCESLARDEEDAILRKLAEHNFHLQSATPNSSFSPTGRRYAEAPHIQLYKHHVLVEQSGGIDC